MATAITVVHRVFMFKKSLLLLITLCCLASFPGVGISEELRLPPGKTSLAPEVLAKLGAQFPEQPSLATDLAALTAGYPGFCLGVEVRGDRKVYLLMKNQTKILYDDGLVKSFEDKLKRPDLKDMLAQVYRPGRDRGPFRPNFDPGRFRVDGLFSAVYGASAPEVGGHLVSVPFCGVRVRVWSRVSSKDPWRDRLRQVSKISRCRKVASSRPRKSSRRYASRRSR